MYGVADERRIARGNYESGDAVSRPVVKCRKCRRLDYVSRVRLYRDVSLSPSSFFFLFVFCVAYTRGRVLSSISAASAELDHFISSLMSCHAAVEHCQQEIAMTQLVLSL